MSLKRFSSRLAPLDTSFLKDVLKGAVRYHRIAGYFHSSIFDLIGDDILAIPEVVILCNSELNAMDMKVAKEKNFKEMWNKVHLNGEVFLYRERYERLTNILQHGNVEIRVVEDKDMFVHGKAGVIEYANGSRLAFIGSANDTQKAFNSNYELIWSDNSDESADWVQAEFDALRQRSIPLPDVIIKEIHRLGKREETVVEVLLPEEVPGAAMVESPMAYSGEQLRPWQRSFVAMFVDHRRVFGKARLLIADEVGLGKTLSLATSALVSVLLGDGPTLILTPPTLSRQWQTEIWDKLGIKTAVWSSQKKVWLNLDDEALTAKAEDGIRKCPFQIGIVSTGLVTHQCKDGKFIKEAAQLLLQKYGMVILDEAHKARTGGGFGEASKKPNNLLLFMQHVAKRSSHVLLGTATPIQTDVRDLWDLLSILNSEVGSTPLVLGDKFSNWHWNNQEEILPLITGNKELNSEEKWVWLRKPLPPPNENHLIDELRMILNITNDHFECTDSYDDLCSIGAGYCLDYLPDNYFQHHNPILRHVVLRKRTDLENVGLLTKVGVNNHPTREQAYDYKNRFKGLGLNTNNPFRLAYEAAEKFCKLLNQRSDNGFGGFMKTLILQRICSSFTSGLKTAERMLKRSELEDAEEGNTEKVQSALLNLTAAEKSCLQTIIDQLSRDEAKNDPKFDTVYWFLKHFKTDDKTWLEHGCIIFSQYYDTVEWIASQLSASFPNEKIAVYAGAGKSRVYKGSQYSSVERNLIKGMVKKRDIRLLVATEAACEGLNLQTLGTLVNVDLPWNPSKLEQRLGRIKRFGQARKYVDMLNLVYSDTQDEKIYGAISERMKDTYDIFGNLPDSIQDAWIDDEERLNAEIDLYIHKRKTSQNAFTIKYKESLEEDTEQWSECTKILARQDIKKKTSIPW